jgi:hypothetical protein
MALHSNRHSHSTAASQAPSLRHTPGPSQRRPAKFGREFDEDSPSLFSRLQLQQVGISAHYLVQTTFCTMPGDIDTRHEIF